jgi:crossover junction endodeoxyribonuclease RuvC
VIALALAQPTLPPVAHLHLAPRTPILALDLATATGWALRDARGQLTSGVQSFALRSGESSGMRLLRFRRWLREVVALGEVRLVAYEQPVIHRQRRQLNRSVAHNLEGVLLAELEGHADYVSPTPAAIKKHATGRGNASKDDMVAAAQTRWQREVADHNEADALCVLAWALDEIGEAP